MQNAWIAIVGSFALLAAACGQYEDPNTSRTSARQSVDETESTESESNLGYGWDTKIEATETNGLHADYSISEIVTNPKVKVRRDAKSCTTCHSWAKNQDRISFCNRVNAFLKMPTAKGNSMDAVGAKPANLKKLLRDWRAEKCPE